MHAYVGSRTTRERNARGDGISVYHVDPNTAELTLVEVVGDLINPSFLALNAKKDRLYTVHGDQSDISAFSIDKSTGKLSFINRESTGGRNPVHLALDPTEGFIVVSNHLGASLAVLPLAEDGALKPLSQLVTLEGTPGPHRVEQNQAKPHFNPFDNSGKFVVVPDKGLDRLFSFQFKEGRLVEEEAASVMARETSGPRNITFHPFLEIAYCINELDSTITTYRVDNTTGALSPMQIITALPPSFTGNSRAAGITVSADGRHVYCSIRGWDGVSIFSVNITSGWLNPSSYSSTGGKTPRFLTLSPHGRHLYVLNEDSDSIVAFGIDPESGQMRSTGSQVTCGSPVCMVFGS